MIGPFNLTFSSYFVVYLTYQEFKSFFQSLRVKQKWLEFLIASNLKIRHNSNKDSINFS